MASFENSVRILLAIGHDGQVDLIALANLRLSRAYGAAYCIVTEQSYRQGGMFRDERSGTSAKRLERIDSIDKGVELTKVTKTSPLTSA
jgi:hypothetical protein